jgi:polygalacturonase
MLHSEFSVGLIAYADSCTDVMIENCYISVGDDGIAIKSGWDQYGIAYGRPSTNITIRHVTIRSMVR